MEGLQPQVFTASTTEVALRWELTVILPAYNEEQAIGRVLDEIVEALLQEPIRYEILVVDDASTDRTASLAEQYACDCRQCSIRVIRCPLRRGAGAARKAGIREARGDVIVMLDADGTYSAETVLIPLELEFSVV